jgi:hypothetical protein
MNILQHLLGGAAVTGRYPRWIRWRLCRFLSGFTGLFLRHLGSLSPSYRFEYIAFADPHLIVVYCTAANGGKLNEAGRKLREIGTAGVGISARSEDSFVMASRLSSTAAPENGYLVGLGSKSNSVGRWRASGITGLSESLLDPLPSDQGVQKALIGIQAL